MLQDFLDFGVVWVHRWHPFWEAFSFKIQLKKRLKLIYFSHWFLLILHPKWFPKTLPKRFRSLFKNQSRNPWICLSISIWFWNVFSVIFECFCFIELSRVPKMPRPPIYSTLSKWIEGRTFRISWKYLVKCMCMCSNKCPFENHPKTFPKAFQNP